MFSSIVSSFLVKPKEGRLAQALHRGTYSAAVLTSIGVFFLSQTMFENINNPIGPFVSVIIGLLVGILVGQISEWFTSDHYSIVKNIADQKTAFCLPPQGRKEARGWPAMRREREKSIFFQQSFFFLSSSLTKTEKKKN